MFLNNFEFGIWNLLLLQFVGLCCWRNCTCEMFESVFKSLLNYERNGNASGRIDRAQGLLTALPATRNSFITWMLDMHFDYTIMYRSSCRFARKQISRADRAVVDSFCKGIIAGWVVGR